MFLYDKDMERVMLAKKKEVLHEIEVAKARVLKELYCVKRSVHTDMAQLLADYNRIDFALKNTVKELRAELDATVQEFQAIMAEKCKAYGDTIEAKLNELEQFQHMVIVEVETKLSELETMQQQVADALERLEDALSDAVTAEDLENLKTEIFAQIGDYMTNSDWNENDETNPAYIKNRTHYGIDTNESVLLDSAFSELELKEGCTALNYSGHHCFKLPIEIPDDTTTITVEITGHTIGTSKPTEFNDKVTATREKKSIFVYNPINEIYNFAENVDTFNFGDINEDHLTYNTYSLIYCVQPWVIYKYDDVWYMATHDNIFVDKAALKIKSKSFRIEQTLDGNYLAPVENYGYHLTCTPDGLQWVKPIGVNYSYRALTTLLDEVSTYRIGNYVAGSSKLLYFDNSAIEFDPLTRYFIEIDGITYVSQTNEAGKLAFSYSIPSITDDEGLCIPSRVMDTILAKTGKTIDEIKTNGVHLRVYGINDIVINEVIPADRLAPNPPVNGFVTFDGGKLIWTDTPVIVSPNGTSYKLTVSDDGTLSAVAVTE